MAKIGIIIGSIREGRLGEVVGCWVEGIARDRAEQGVDYELIDLAAFNVPLLTAATVPDAANKQYDDANVQAWSQAIDSCDAFVFVTPEYNHSVPGAFKNAYDSLGAEWAGKPVAFVGYGASGAIRAVEAWRLVVSNFQMAQLRNQLEVTIFSDFTDGEFTPGEDKIQRMDNILAGLEDALGK